MICSMHPNDCLTQSDAFSGIYTIVVIGCYYNTDINKDLCIKKNDKYFIISSISWVFKMFSFFGFCFIFYFLKLLAGSGLSI